MSAQENNDAALDLVGFAVRAGYRIEIYDLYVCVDDETGTLLLSPAKSPVTLDSPRREVAKKPPAA